ncbi:protein kinase [Halobacteria archaeon HArc-gm2]|nr:protein kinase [Halobacteria archaeon HArc-gm2]
MTEDAASGRDEPIASLLAVFDDPTTGRRRLPGLVGKLDAEAESVRLGAAWAICHVAAHLPDTAAYLTRRLADRIDDEEPSLEAELAFDYVAARYPEAVTEELAAMETEAESRPRYWPVEGSLARANYHRPAVGERDVGRTRLAGEGNSSGPQRVYTDDGSSHDRLQRGTDGATGDPMDEDEADDGDVSNESPDAKSASANDSDGQSIDGPGWQPADDIPTIVADSRFDQLTVLAKRRRGRYADVYRTLGVVDGEQLPVGLSLLHRPSQGADAFATAIDERLARWAGVDDHDNVVAVYDWGLDPRPWTATEYMGFSLADRDRLDRSEALFNARGLAAAVTHLHENGVVHGGIDPGNVVYSGNVIDEDEVQPPLLDDVGLLHVVRNYFDPTSRLDPRYAAPEYFDRRFGRIDHATDVYHLGALVYLLFTGDPPYDGEYGRIRDRVLSDPPPRPSDVADVPEGLDDVVTKAMARQKLQRYEAVTHMEQELRRIGMEDET